jgi:dienelactone hydrolase
MKQSIFSAARIVAIAAVITSCNNQPATSTEPTTTAAAPAAVSIKEEEVTYQSDTTTCHGFVAYNENDSAKRPAILVVPEWWGVTGYVKMRARELAKLGYIAIAVDIFGNGKIAANPDEAGKTAMPFYKNPALAKSRIDAALAKIKSYPQADTAKIAAIGYCFGGGMVLNVARLGEHFNGVVSFHGSLVGTPADKNLLKAKVLVCHGADDKFVSQDELNKFKKQMDSIGASYTVKVYPGATHAFTNPEATALGQQFKIPIAYNAAADSASWKDMRAFFATIF